MKLIGIYGYARSGKDTIGEHVVVNYDHKRYAFADPLKKACCEMFGITMNHFNNPELKEKVIPFWGFSPRRMAQLLGTEGGRNLFRDDIWIKRAELELLKCDEEGHHTGMIITDMRFENELNWVKARGGCLIKVTRPGVKGAVTSHASEQYFEDELFDHVITNDGTLDDLYLKTASIMTHYDFADVEYEVPEVQVPHKKLLN